MTKVRHAGFYPVWDYIEENLDDKIGLNQLAFLTTFSPWHFHRQFRKHLGENIQHYIKRLRIEKAAYEIKISNFPILEIAMEAGYESNEAFTRAFKRYMKVTPSQYRNDLQKKSSALKSKSNGIRSFPGIDLGEIRIKEIPSLHVAYTRHFGPYNTLPGPLPESKEVKTIIKLIEDIQSKREFHKWIGMSLDDPAICKPEKIRFDLGITIGKKTKEYPNIGYKTIPDGKHLVVRARGDYNNLPEIYDFILNQYIPTSKIQLRNLPPFEIYINPFSDASQIKITDIYIPISKSS
jgi:AraC family transcriptional regulator